MAKMVLGRYAPYDTYLHRMDPRAKIFAFILLVVTVFLRYANYAMDFLIGGTLFVFALVVLLTSKSSFRSFLSSLKSLWFMLIILVILYVFIPKSAGFYAAPHIAFKIKEYPIYWESFLDAGRIFLRLLLMVEFSMILTATTKPLELTYGLEWYMTPFKAIGFPAHIFAMIISLALRFIPTILEDVERIIKAQASRGVDFENGRVGTKLRAVTSLIVPLFASAFIRSDELANAMECRGYDPNAKRTRYRKLSFRRADLFLTLFIMALFGGALTLAILKFDMFTEWFHYPVWQR